VLTSVEFGGVWTLHANGDGTKSVEFLLHEL